RMELHAHERPLSVADSLVGAVVGVRKPGFPTVREGFDIDRITVVLGGEVTARRSCLKTRLILTPVPEFQFVSVCTGRQRQDLMPETKPKDWQISLHSLSHVTNRCGAHLGISRSVRNQYAIKSFIQKIVIPWHPCDRESPGK